MYTHAHDTFEKKKNACKSDTTFTEVKLIVTEFLISYGYTNEDTLLVAWFIEATSQPI